MISVTQETIDGVWSGNFTFMELVEETNKLAVQVREENADMTEGEVMEWAIEGIAEGYELRQSVIKSLHNYFVSAGVV